MGEWVGEREREQGMKGREGQISKDKSFEDSEIESLAGIGPLRGDLVGAEPSIASHMSFPICNLSFARSAPSAGFFGKDSTFTFSPEGKRDLMEISFIRPVR